MLQAFGVDGLVLASFSDELARAIKEALALQNAPQQDLAQVAERGARMMYATFRDIATVVLAVLGVLVLAVAAVKVIRARRRQRDEDRQERRELAAWYASSGMGAGPRVEDER